jgi:hypothetical protein
MVRPAIPIAVAAQRIAYQLCQWALTLLVTGSNLNEWRS